MTRGPRPLLAVSTIASLHVPADSYDIAHPRSSAPSTSLAPAPAENISAEERQRFARAEALRRIDARMAALGVAPSAPAPLPPVPVPAVLDPLAPDAYVPTTPDFRLSRMVGPVAIAPTPPPAPPSSMDTLEPLARM